MTATITSTSTITMPTAIIMTTAITSTTSTKRRTTPTAMTSLLPLAADDNRKSADVYKHWAVIVAQFVEWSLLTLFESSHRQILFTSNCIEKTKIKQKRDRERLKFFNIADETQTLESF